VRHSKTLSVALLAVCIYFMIYYIVDKQYAIHHSLLLQVSFLVIYALSPNRNIKNAISLFGQTKIIFFSFLALLISLPSSNNYLLIIFNAISNSMFFIAGGFLSAKLFRWEGWR
jgi:hypothetical protein